MRLTRDIITIMTATTPTGGSSSSSRSLAAMAVYYFVAVSFLGSSYLVVGVHGWSTSTPIAATAAGSAAAAGRRSTSSAERRSTTTTSLSSFPLRHELTNSCVKPSSGSSVRNVFNKIKNCRGGHQQQQKKKMSTSTALEQTASSSSEADNKSLLSKLQNIDQRKQLKAMTAGLAVSLAMIPEAVAFAFVAGVNPLVGLWTTVIVGFTAATLGGRPGICSSASGAVSVVIAALCKSHGPQYLSACAILAGIIQITCGGLLKMGKLINLVPHPVMLGFVNGLAIVMTKAQMMHFQDIGASGGTFMSLTSPVGSATYGIAAFTMILVKLIPKLTKVVPPSLGAVALASMIAKLFHLPAKTLSDVAGASTFVGGWSVLPKIGLPNVPFNMDMIQTIFPYAATMAAVGCLESLLTMQLIDGMMASDDDAETHTPSSAKQECIGQGTGNILSGLTGGIGGCALLGQSIINVQSGGGVSKLSGMSMAVFLGLGIVAAAPLLANVPVASLVGVMLLVCYSTFSWSSLRLFNKIPKLDAAVIALVSIVTVQKDLAVAVLAGTVTSALGFAYKQSTAFKSTYEWVDKEQTKKKKYNLRGPLFFGSTKILDTKIFTPSTIASDPDEVVLDFTEARIMDHSAVDAIHTLSDKYTELGKTVTLQGLCVDSTKILTRYCRGRQSPPFQMVNTDDATNGQKDTTVYKALPV